MKRKNIYLWVGVGVGWRGGGHDFIVPKTNSIQFSSICIGPTMEEIHFEYMKYRQN